MTTSVRCVDPRVVDAFKSARKAADDTRMTPVSAASGQPGAAHLMLLRQTMDVAQASMATLMSAMPAPVRQEAGLAPLDTGAALDVRV